ncbi:MAG: hypothetical protein H8D23_01825 [Candidatus Brocadiales bacterium]|nr:hypothetical protein [Candidatus Brocadiales bacterium]
MSEKNSYESIKEVLHIKTDNCNSRCQFCDDFPKGFQSTINHYISKHSYKLLNVGTESSEHSDGSLVHDTAALLGK